MKTFIIYTSILCLIILQNLFYNSIITFMPLINCTKPSKVSNQYTKKPVNIKIQGAGVGGCDIVLNPGDVDSSDCW